MLRAIFSKIPKQTQSSPQAIFNAQAERGIHTSQVVRGDVHKHYPNMKVRGHIEYTLAPVNQHVFSGFFKDMIPRWGRKIWLNARYPLPAAISTYILVTVAHQEEAREDARIERF